MPEYSKSKDGYHFEPSELGKTMPHIYGKYDLTYEQKTSFLHHVPSKWVKEGYVEEVEDGKE